MPLSDEDLKLLWEALTNMFEHDRSAARGEMTMRGIYVFKHDSDLGNAPAFDLLSCIQPKFKAAVTAPRDFADYEIAVDGSNLPKGVTLTRLVG